MYKRSFWTETFVAWSPHGSYLATMHRQGAAIWGGPSFSRLQRFSHPNVRPPVRCCSLLSQVLGAGDRSLLWTLRSEVLRRHAKERTRFAWQRLSVAAVLATQSRNQS